MSDESSPRTQTTRGWSQFVGSMAPESRWYAVQCLSQREATAAAHLANQEFEVFLPRRRRTRRHAHKIDLVLMPFFPGYLFVQIDLTRHRWRSINGTYGVSHLVMQGERPAPAPRGVIEALRDCCDENDVLLMPGDELRPGQSVRILVGAFTDFIGEIDRLDDSGRVRVLLNILGGQTPVVLPLENIVRAESFL